jgi:signal transduction histidine kinase
MPEAGAAVTSAKQQILARWRSSVTTTLPQSDELTRRQLEDSLPQLLDRIAAALASSNPSTTEELIALSPDHGRTRYHQEFSLNQVLIEYHILRRIVLEEMTNVLGRELATDESVAVNQSIDVGLRQAAVAYADHQTANLKVEAAAMTKFLSFLSHDMRGGLNGAVLMIEVLKRELAGEEKFAAAVEDLDVVRRSILDTVAMMERFLSAEKLRHGRMPVKISTIDVDKLLAELQKGFAYQLKDKGIEMETRIEPTELKISSDRELLTMVLQNLISNAIKYTRRSNVGLAAVAGGGAVPKDVLCRFMVSDKGPGIAPEKLATIFAPFARGETYGQKGVGLGLFIARQAADLLNAKLWAESKPNEGTTFYFDLVNVAPRT